MSNEIPLKCACGKMTGKVTDAASAYRVVCYCRYCQAYARELGREGELLDAHGGSQVYPLTPAQIKFDTGAEHLRCLRLLPKGAMRFHAGCCKTPIANTMDKAKVAWLGLSARFVDHEAAGLTPEEGFGPIRYRVHARHASSPPPEGNQRYSRWLVLRTVTGMTLDGLRGRAFPSPFFDKVTRAPMVEPRVLTDDERAAIGLKR